MADNHGAALANNRAEQAEEQIRAFEMRVAGCTIRDIAKDLECSVGKAHRLIEKEIEARKWPVVSAWREVELTRLEAMHQALWGMLPDLAKSGQLAGILAVMDRIHKIGDRRSKLLGLDAPVKVDATVHEVTQQDLELDELLREAKAQAAAAEQAVKNGAGQ